MTDKPKYLTVHAAFVAAQAELTNPHKDKTANIKAGFSYTYADLATILDHVRPVLARHGLAVSQNVTEADGGRLAVSTTLVHDSGEVLTFGPLVGDSGRDWQGLGSAITYARRYALCAALGIAADDDDDAQTAPSKAKAKPQETKPVMGPDQFAAIADAMRSCNEVGPLVALAERAATFDMTTEQRDALRSLYVDLKAAINGTEDAS